MIKKKRLALPGILSLTEKMADNAVLDGKKNLGEDWENRFRDDEDPNCELVYGVKNGKAYGYALQHDFEEYKKLAKYLRELEKDGSQKDSWLGTMKWVLPRAIMIDLEARGYPISEIMASGDFSDIDHYVEDNCPELKTTKLMLKPLFKGKALI